MKELVYSDHVSSFDELLKKDQSFSTAEASEERGTKEHVEFEARAAREPARHKARKAQEHVRNV